MMQRQEILNTLTQQLQNLDDTALLNLLGFLKAIDVQYDLEAEQETREILADERAMRSIKRHEENISKAKSLDDLKAMGYKTLDEVLVERGLNV